MGIPSLFSSNMLVLAPSVPIVLIANHWCVRCVRALQFSSRVLRESRRNKRDGRGNPGARRRAKRPNLPLRTTETPPSPSPPSQNPGLVGAPPPHPGAERRRLRSPPSSLIRSLPRASTHSRWFTFALLPPPRSRFGLPTKTLTGLRRYFIAGSDHETRMALLRAQKVNPRRNKKMFADDTDSLLVTPFTAAEVSQVKYFGKVEVAVRGQHPWIGVEAAPGSMPCSRATRRPERPLHEGRTRVEWRTGAGRVRRVQAGCLRLSQA